MDSRPSVTVRPRAESRIPRINILGTGFSELNQTLAVAEIGRLIDSGQTGYVTITNADGSVRARADERLRSVYNSSFLTTPDGMPAVWICRARGHATVERVYGPDLMLQLFIEGRRRGWTHFLYGGREGVAEALKARMERRFPGTRIVGTYCPPFRDLTEEEREELIERVNQLRPDIVWVGISTPRQDCFMAEMLGRLDTAVMIGVGAAFDFHSGRIRQAPTWIQDAGLEWFYRLLHEPRRLIGRYVHVVPRFVWHSMAQILCLKQYPPVNPVADHPEL